MLFKDDLADQGGRMAAAFPQIHDVVFRWLRGLTSALDELGMSMQAGLCGNFKTGNFDVVVGPVSRGFRW